MHVGPTSLQFRIPFDVGIVLILISFDVVTVSTQAIPYYHASKFAWGEH